MQKMNKIISTIVLIAFLLNTVASDLAFAQTPNVDTLAIGAKTDDILGTEFRDMRAISMWFQGCVALIARKGFHVNFNSIRDAKILPESVINGLEKTQIFRNEALQDPSTGTIRIKVKRREGLSTKTYYIEYSEEGVVRVYPEGKAPAPAKIVTPQSHAAAREAGIITGVSIIIAATNAGKLAAADKGSISFTLKEFRDACVAKGFPANAKDIEHQIQQVLGLLVREGYLERPSGEVYVFTSKGMVELSYQGPQSIVDGLRFNPGNPDLIDSIVAAVSGLAIGGASESTREPGKSPAAAWVTITSSPIIETFLGPELKGFFLMDAYEQAWLEVAKQKKWGDSISASTIERDLYRHAESLEALGLIRIPNKGKKGEAYKIELTELGNAAYQVAKLFTDSTSVAEKAIKALKLPKDADASGIEKLLKGRLGLVENLMSMFVGPNRELSERLGQELYIRAVNINSRLLAEAEGKDDYAVLAVSSGTPGSAALPVVKSKVRTVGEGTEQARLDRFYGHVKQHRGNADVYKMKNGYKVIDFNPITAGTTSRILVINDKDRCIKIIETKDFAVLMNVSPAGRYFAILETDKGCRVRIYDVANPDKPIIERPVKINANNRGDKYRSNFEYFMELRDDRNNFAIFNEDETVVTLLNITNPDSEEHISLVVPAQAAVVRRAVKSKKTPGKSPAGGSGSAKKARLDMPGATIFDPSSIDALRRAVRDPFGSRIDGQGLPMAASADSKGDQAKKVVSNTVTRILVVPSFANEPRYIGIDEKMLSDMIAENPRLRNELNQTAQIGSDMMMPSEANEEIANSGFKFVTPTFNPFITSTELEGACVVLIKVEGEIRIVLMQVDGDGKIIKSGIVVKPEHLYLSRARLEQGELTATVGESIGMTPRTLGYPVWQDYFQQEAFKFFNKGLSSEKASVKTYAPGYPGREEAEVAIDKAGLRSLLKSSLLRRDTELAKELAVVAAEIMTDPTLDSDINKAIAARKFKFVTPTAVCLKDFYVYCVLVRDGKRLIPVLMELKSDGVGNKEEELVTIGIVDGRALGFSSALLRDKDNFMASAGSSAFGEEWAKYFKQLEQEQGARPGKDQPAGATKRTQAALSMMAADAATGLPFTVEGSTQRRERRNVISSGPTGAVANKANQMTAVPGASKNGPAASRKPGESIADARAREAINAMLVGPLPAGITYDDLISVIMKRNDGLAVLENESLKVIPSVHWMTLCRDITTILNSESERPKDPKLTAKAVQEVYGRVIDKMGSQERERINDLKLKLKKLGIIPEDTRIGRVRVGDDGSAEIEFEYRRSGISTAKVAEKDKLGNTAITTLYRGNPDRIRRTILNESDEVLFNHNMRFYDDERRGGPNNFHTTGNGRYVCFVDIETNTGFVYDLSNPADPIITVGNVHSDDDLKIDPRWNAVTILGKVYDLSKAQPAAEGHTEPGKSPADARAILQGLGYVSLPGEQKMFKSVSLPGENWFMDMGVNPNSFSFEITVRGDHMPGICKVRRYVFHKNMVTITIKNKEMIGMDPVRYGPLKARTLIYRGAPPVSSVRASKDGKHLYYLVNERFREFMRSNGLRYRLTETLQDEQKCGVVFCPEDTPISKNTILVAEVKPAARRQSRAKPAASPAAKDDVKQARLDRFYARAKEDIGNAKVYKMTHGYKVIKPAAAPRSHILVVNGKNQCIGAIAIKDYIPLIILSPSGKYFAILEPDEGRRVRVYDVTNPDKPVISRPVTVSGKKHRYENRLGQREHYKNNFQYFADHNSRRVEFAVFAEDETTVTFNNVTGPGSKERISLIAPVQAAAARKMRFEMPGATIFDPSSVGALRRAIMDPFDSRIDGMGLPMASDVDSHGDQAKRIITHSEAAAQGAESRGYLTDLQIVKRILEKDVIEMIYKAGSGHPGGSLSMLNMITALYFGNISFGGKIMKYDPKDPNWVNRDRFVLSKGHAAPGLYAALGEAGFFSKYEFKKLRLTDAMLQGHPDMTKTPGVDMSAGSIGVAISAAVGMAMAAKLDGRDYVTYCMLGDGETQEGQVDEAARHAAAMGLDNMIAFLDWNGYQIDGSVTDVDVDYQKQGALWNARGWNVVECDGSDMESVLAAINRAHAMRTLGKPTIIIAKTTKGAGLPGMSKHGAAPKEAEVKESLELINADIAKLAGEKFNAGWFMQYLMQNRTDAAKKERDFRDAAWAARNRESRDALQKIVDGPSAQTIIKKAQEAYPADKKIATRTAEGDELVTLGAVDLDMVAICADLRDSVKFDKFAAAFGTFSRNNLSGRYIPVGIREAHMVSLAAGLAACGKIPVIGTFSVFTTRMVDQLNAVLNTKLPIIIVGSHGGLATGPDGRTHQDAHSLRILGSLPNVKIYEAADAEEARELMRYIHKSAKLNGGIHYIRVARLDTPAIPKPDGWQAGAAKGFYELFDTEKGKGTYTNPQRDVVIVSSGVTAVDAIAAAKELALRGRKVKVVNVTQPKALVESPQNMIVFSNMISASYHLISVIDALPETLAESINGVLVKMGKHNATVQALGINKYGESGEPRELYAAHGFDKDGIVKAAESVCARLNIASLEQARALAAAPAKAATTAAAAEAPPAKPQPGEGTNDVDMQFLEAARYIEVGDIENTKACVIEAIRLLRETDSKEVREGRPVADTVNQVAVAKEVLHLLEMKGVLPEGADKLLTYLDGGVSGNELKKALRHTGTPAAEASPERWKDPKDLQPEKRVVILISGTEAAGVNNYFALLARKLAAQGMSLELVKFGLDGLIRTKVEFDESRVWVDWKKAEKIMDMPGATEGTARVRLGDKEHPEYMNNVVANLKGYCKTVIIVGGNDHMGEADKLAKRLKADGTEDILVIALPKTIDRDTKVYPIGADSAGEHANELVRRASARARPGSGNCVVIQAMGRDMGSLAVRAGDLNDPTVIVAVPEYSYDPNTGETKVSLSDIVEAAGKIMARYGAVTIVASEGFRIKIPAEDDPGYKQYMKENPLLAEVLANKFLKAKFDKFRIDPNARDPQGNLKLTELSIGDFITEALSLGLGLVREKNLFFEDIGYSCRARQPNELDRTIAENATTAAFQLITDENARRDAIGRGGVCIAAERAIRKVQDATVKVMNLSDATGKVDLTNSGIYSPDELRDKNVLGAPGSSVAGRPAYVLRNGNGRTRGYNLKTAAEVINSQAESARGMMGMRGMKRPNVCVIARDDADEIIKRLRTMVPVSKADRYVMARAAPATLYHLSFINESLSEIIEYAYRIYDKCGFLNLVIPGSFPISEKDMLLPVLRKDPACSALIEAAKPDGKGNLIFDRRLVELLFMALQSEDVLKSLRTLGLESKKAMSDVRKNILGESLNILPGEIDIPAPVPAATTTLEASLMLQIAVVNSRGLYSAEIIHQQGHILVKFTDKNEEGTHFTVIADKGFRVTSWSVAGKERLRVPQDLDKDLGAGIFSMFPCVNRIKDGKIIRNRRVIDISSIPGLSIDKGTKNPMHGVARVSESWKDVTIGVDGGGVFIQASFETTDYPGLAEALGHSKLTKKYYLAGHDLRTNAKVENLTTPEEARRDGGYEVIADVGEHPFMVYTPGKTTLQAAVTGVFPVDGQKIPSGAPVEPPANKNFNTPQLVDETLDNTFTIRANSQGVTGVTWVDEENGTTIFRMTGMFSAEPIKEAVIHFWGGNTTNFLGIGAVEAVPVTANGPNRQGQIGGSRPLAQGEVREGSVTMTVTPAASAAVLAPATDEVPALLIGDGITKEMLPGLLKGDVKAQTELAKANLVIALKAIDATGQFSPAQKEELAGILNKLFAAALPDFEKGAKEIPVYYHTQALANMVEICLYEGLTYEEFRNAAILALLHERGSAFVTVAPEALIKKAAAALKSGKQEEIKRLFHEIMECRVIKHMVVGSSLAGETMKPFVEKGLIKAADADLICQAIKVHANPAIEKAMEVWRDGGAEFDEPRGHYLFKFDDSPLSRLLTFLREANRLYILTPQGAMDNLIAHNKEVSGAALLDQLESCLKSCRNEYGLYVKAGMDDKKFKHNTLFRTDNGYFMFNKAEDIVMAGREADAKKAIREYLAILAKARPADLLIMARGRLEMISRQYSGAASDILIELILEKSPMALTLEEALLNASSYRMMQWLGLSLLNLHEGIYKRELALKRDKVIEALGFIHGPGSYQLDIRSDEIVKEGTSQNGFFAVVNVGYRRETDDPNSVFTFSFDRKGKSRKERVKNDVEVDVDGEAFLGADLSRGNKKEATWVVTDEAFKAIASKLVEKGVLTKEKAAQMSAAKAIELDLCVGWRFWENFRLTIVTDGNAKGREILFDNWEKRLETRVDLASPGIDKEAMVRRIKTLLGAVNGHYRHLFYPNLEGAFNEIRGGNFNNVIFELNEFLEALNRQSVAVKESLSPQDIAEINTIVTYTKAVLPPFSGTIRMDLYGNPISDKCWIEFGDTTKVCFVEAGRMGEGYPSVESRLWRGNPLIAIGPAGADKSEKSGADLVVVVDPGFADFARGFFNSRTSDYGQTHFDMDKFSVRVVTASDPLAQNLKPLIPAPSEWNKPVTLAAGQAMAAAPTTPESEVPIAEVVAEASEEEEGDPSQIDTDGVGDWFVGQDASMPIRGLDFVTIAGRDINLAQEEQLPKRVRNELIKLQNYIARFAAARNITTKDEIKKALSDLGIKFRNVQIDTLTDISERTLDMITNGDQSRTWPLGYIVYVKYKPWRVGFTQLVPVLLGKRVGDGPDQYCKISEESVPGVEGLIEEIKDDEQALERTTRVDIMRMDREEIPAPSVSEARAPMSEETAATLKTFYDDMMGNVPASSLSGTIDSALASKGKVSPAERFETVLDVFKGMDEEGLRYAQALEELRGFIHAGSDDKLVAALLEIKNRELDEGGLFHNELGPIAMAFFEFSPKGAATRVPSSAPTVPQSLVDDIVKAALNVASMPLDDSVLRERTEKLRTLMATADYATAVDARSKFVEAVPPDVRTVMTREYIAAAAVMNERIAQLEEQSAATASTSAAAVPEISVPQSLIGATPAVVQLHASINAGTGIVPDQIGAIRGALAGNQLDVARLSEMVQRGAFNNNPGLLGQVSAFLTEARTRAMEQATAAEPVPAAPGASDEETVAARDTAIGAAIAAQQTGRPIVVTEGGADAAIMNRLRALINPSAPVTVNGMLDLLRKVGTVRAGTTGKEIIIDLPGNVIDVTDEIREAIRSVLKEKGMLAAPDPTAPALNNAFIRNAVAVRLAREAAQPIMQEQLEDLKETAREVGSVIPTAADTRYTLLVDNNLYEGEEFSRDQQGILMDGRYIGPANRFNLEKVDSANVDNILAHVKDASRTIVQVSSSLSDADLAKLKEMAPGLRVMRIDTAGLKYDDKLNSSERQLCRFDLYAMMLAGRQLTGDDISAKDASRAYRLMIFFLSSHLKDGETVAVDDYLEALVKNDLKVIIQCALSYKPASVYKAPEYHTVALTLISA
jgi:transketolase